MFKAIARTSALIATLTVLGAPGGQMFAATAPSTTPPTVVTGGDPQPTGESVMRLILLLPSLIVL